MPDISVSLPAIVFAVLNQFLWALVWYGIFVRKIYAAEMNINPDNRPENRQLAKSMLIMLGGNFLMATVLAVNIAVWDPVSWGFEAQSRSSLTLAAKAAFFIWLGFVLPVMLAAVAWSGRTWRYVLINAVYYLVGLFFMAATLTHF